MIPVIRIAAGLWVVSFNLWFEVLPGIAPSVVHSTRTELELDLIIGRGLQRGVGCQHDQVGPGYGAHVSNWLQQLQRFVQVTIYNPVISRKEPEQ